MPTDPFFLAVASLLVAIFFAGLRMTGTKILGLALILFSLTGLWAWFQPTTPALLWGGEGAIFILCILYGRYIYEPAKRAELIQPSRKTSLSRDRQDQVDFLSQLITRGESLIELFRSSELSLRDLNNLYDSWQAEVSGFFYDHYSSVVRFLEAPSEKYVDDNMARGMPDEIKQNFLLLYAQVGVLRNIRAEIEMSTD